MESESLKSAWTAWRSRFSKQSSLGNSAASSAKLPCWWHPGDPESEKSAASTAPSVSLPGQDTPTLLPKSPGSERRADCRVPSFSWCPDLPQQSRHGPWNFLPERNKLALGKTTSWLEPLHPRCIPEVSPQPRWEYCQVPCATEPLSEVRNLRMSLSEFWYLPYHIWASFGPMVKRRCMNLWQIPIF